MTTMKDVALKAVEMGKAQAGYIAKLEAELERLKEWKLEAIQLLAYAGKQGTMRDAEEWLDAIQALGDELVTTSVASNDGAE